MQAHRLRFERIVRLCAALLSFTTMAARAAMPVVTAPATRPTTREVAADPLEATRFSLHLTDAHPQEVFGELARAAGVTLRTNPHDLWSGHDWPKLSIDLEDATFWTAMRDACGKANVTIQRIGADRDMALAIGMPKLWAGYPCVEHGPFMIVLYRINRRHDVNLSAPEETRRVCTLGMGLLAEPKVWLLKVAQVAQIEQAVDENGLILPSQPIPYSGRSDTPMAWKWDMAAYLNTPPGTGERIARLKGNVRVTVRTKSESCQIDEIQTAHNVERTLDGHKLLVKDVRRNNGETFTLSLSVNRDPAKKGGWGDINLASTFHMLDAAGRPLSRRNFGAGGGEGDQASLSLTFGRDDWAGGEGAGEPVKLVWEIPTEAKELSIPFEFVDVPLP